MSEHAPPSAVTGATNTDRIEYYPVHEHPVSEGEMDDPDHYRATVTTDDSETWGRGETPIQAVVDYYRKVADGRRGAGEAPDTSYRYYFTTLVFAESDGVWTVEEDDSETSGGEGRTKLDAVRDYCSKVLGARRRRLMYELYRFACARCGGRSLKRNNQGNWQCQGGIDHHHTPAVFDLKRREWVTEDDSQENYLRRRTGAA